MPRRWVFPAGVELAAGRLPRRALRSHAPALDHSAAQHRLWPDGRRRPVYLFNTPADGSAARLVDLRPAGGRLLHRPRARRQQRLDPDAAHAAAGRNIAARAGRRRTLQINEWMADPATAATTGSNSTTRSPAGRPGRTVPHRRPGQPHQASASRRSPSSAPAPTAYQSFIADNNTGAGADHVNFKLTAERRSHRPLHRRRHRDRRASPSARRRRRLRGPLARRHDDHRPLPRTPRPGDANYLPLDQRGHQRGAHPHRPAARRRHRAAQPHRRARRHRRLVPQRQPATLAQVPHSRRTRILAAGRLPGLLRIPVQSVDPAIVAELRAQLGQGDEVYLSAADAGGSLTGYRARRQVRRRRERRLLRPLRDQRGRGLRRHEPADLRHRRRGGRARPTRSRSSAPAAAPPTPTRRSARSSSAKSCIIRRTSPAPTTTCSTSSSNCTTSRATPCRSMTRTTRPTPGGCATRWTSTSRPARPFRRAASCSWSALIPATNARRAGRLPRAVRLVSRRAHRGSLRRQAGQRRRKRRAGQARPPLAARGSRRRLRARVLVDKVKYYGQRAVADERRRGRAVPAAPERRPLRQ